MTDEADSSVVLAELQVALFRECNNQRLSQLLLCGQKILVSCLHHVYHNYGIILHKCYKKN